MMLEHDCGVIPVVEDKIDFKPVGIITDRDIVCRTVAWGENPLEIKVSECMSKPCVTVEPETTVKDCCKVMEDYKIRRVPVVDVLGRCCGIISQADIATHYLRDEITEVLEKVSQRGQVVGASW